MKAKIVIALWCCLLLTLSCKDDLGLSSGSLNGDGHLTLEIVSSAQTGITVGSRSAGNDDLIDNVVLFVYQEGTLITKQFQTITGSKALLDIYLKSNTKESPYTIYTVCNYKDPQVLLDRITDESKLKEEALRLTSPDEAFSGKYVMFGKQEGIVVSGRNFSLSDGNSGAISPDDGRLILKAERLAAKFDVTITFDPTFAGDKLEIGEVSVVNVPCGAYLEPRAGTAGDLKDGKLSLPDNDGDWVYADSDDERKKRYFDASTNPYVLTLQKKQQEQQAGEEKSGFTYTTSFSLLENRRGKLNEKMTTLWPLNLAEYYRQVFKAGFVNSADMPHGIEVPSVAKVGSKDENYQQEKLISKYASYLKIKGFYYRKGVEGSLIPEERSEVTYFILLGADNFSDYNVCRNTYYKYHINIHTADELDTRLDYELISGLGVMAPTDILDSHCNSTRALIASKGDWEIKVENPDLTPWLEVSKQEMYRPHIAGEEFKPDSMASYYLEGKPGMDAFYIHTDEFIPNVNKPEENNLNAVREGKIICRLKGTDDRREILVRQYAAQMVILHIGYDVHTMKEVRDTFYVERKLERKYMSWGFAHYWSFITDDLIASGQWDGLSNTRKLYDVALKGDKWGVKPAYPNTPEGKLPGLESTGKDGERLGDTALGYAVGKNRDRNGNGTIDRDEILWYLPANRELKLLRSQIDNLYVVIDANEDYFHSSTPSSADPAGVTPGFVYYVKMKSGKDGLAWRTRMYNALACRRRNNEWRGPGSPGTGGGVTTDPEWEDDEVIMPK